jgi:hypothetical protein
MWIASAHLTQRSDSGIIINLANGIGSSHSQHKAFAQARRAGGFHRIRCVAGHSQ